MAESANTIRLMKAAKEFNIGKDTLVDFLTKSGFKVDNNPNAILSEGMYDALMMEYAADKAAKKKSESVVLSKNQVEEKKLKEEKKEVVSLKQEDAVKVVAKGKIDLDEKPKTKKAVAEEDAVEEPVAAPAKSKKAKAEEPAVVPEPAVEAEVPKPKKAAAKDAEKVKIDAPELEGPKVLGKIDLNAKPPKAKVEAETHPEVELPDESDDASTAKPAPEEVTLHTISREKLEGPKIVGKIELPIASDKDQKPKEKRKRKRIPIDGKKPDSGVKPQGREGERKPPFNRDNRPGSRIVKRDDDKPIDQSEIQDKIKQTLAKLGTTTRGKSLKAKYRRNKREEMAEKRAKTEGEREDNKLQLTEFITVSELASLMDVGFNEVIGKCMSLGIMVSINQRLDAEVIELVASEFGFEVEFINLEQEADQEMDIEDDPADMESRPPIVTIMGHVDHGKTSLLDYIRSASVVAGEAGGITQHIGAYEVTLGNGKQITFLDTPGHEAFTAMRARGAKLTDIAVIVIAADDSVMPQTREAISHAQAAGVPMIFAINKIDKDGANADRIREQLSAMNILVEEWGGKFQSQEISAKSGLNVDVLLEKILLEAEILDLKANPNRYANGTIVEASLDKGRGFVSTILVQSGTLEIGDMIVAGSIFGRVKAMSDERGKKKKNAGPSTPVQILGLNGAPQSGEKFKVYEDEDEAKEVATHRAQILREQGMRTKKHITLDEIGRRLALGNFKQLNVIIKGDVDGSVEALSDSLQKLSTDEIAVSVVHKAVGQITESDVLLATASDAIILGFQVRPSMQASKIAENENIEIRYYSIIYDAIEEIKSAMEGLLEPKIEKKAVCNIEVREVFKITGVGAIAGCYVLDGKIKRENKINLVRDGIVIFTGEMASLKRYKDDVKEVFSGTECGIAIKNYNDLQIGDIIEGFEEIEVKRTL
ncbi:MAG: translation initiation factor IF-2 [Chitinophagaceae bacterium]|nr:translation initiation factor IF-2 [Chitinophagaceae bacterium]